MMTKYHSPIHGFTLIELSIVLVIIGLIVGGVLVGRDLIRAAEMRAQISQIEKYHTATNTFRTKYNELPGDASAATATRFGLLTRAGTAGRGDGNSIVEGWWYQGSTVFGWEALGEPAFFWSDLSSMKLVDGSFTSITDAAPAGSVTPSTYVPTAKIGGVNANVNVYSLNQTNHFTISGYSTITNAGNICSAGCTADATPIVTVAQAYNIDKKIDDGLPLNGTVTTFFNTGAGFVQSPNAVSDSTSTCYNTGANVAAYSITQNNGNGINCALSFRFQ